MKKQKNLLLIALLILAIIFVVFTYKNNSSQNNDTYQIQKTIDRLENKNDDLQNEIENLEQENNNLQNNSIEVQEQEFETEECVGEFCNGDGSEDTQGQTTINVPLIFGQGNIGCGVGMAFMPYTVPQTTGVMGATYEKLFLLSQQPLNTYSNVVAAWPQLNYQSVSLTSGLAKVYLTGSMNGGPGHCSIPSMRAQISQAALQFPTVNTVEVYLNGVIYDWCAMDESGGEGGCPGIPQLWIDN